MGDETCMPVAPIKPLVLAYTEFNGERNRPAASRNSSGNPSQAVERIIDELSLSARAMKLSREATTQAPGAAQRDEPTAGRPARRLNLTA